MQTGGSKTVGSETVDSETRRSWNLWGWAEDYWDQLGRISDIWWTRRQGPASVGEAQQARFAALLDFSRRYSPLYREACRGLPEKGVVLQDLPVMHKRKLMARFDQWVTDPALTRDGVQEFLSDPQRIGERYLGRYGVWKSSGTTGEPGIFVHDQEALATYDALLAVQINAFEHVLLAARYALGCATRGGRAALVVATGHHFATIATWARLARSHPWLDSKAFSITTPLPQLVEALNGYQPAFLSSYPTLLSLLALEQSAGRLRLQPSLLWCGGERLTGPAQRAIETAFGCPLLAEYGASECMSIAFGCDAGWLHVNSDWLILEPVDSDYQPVPAGQLSDTVLLTNLANRVQPLLRYDLGDRIVVNPEPCACGSLLPAIRVEGRDDDVLWLHAQDGTPVPVLPIALTTVIEEETGLHYFQVVQEAPDRLRIRTGHCHPDCEQASEAACRSARNYLAGLSLANITVDADTQEPALDHSGKLRQVVGSQV